MIHRFCLALLVACALPLAAMAQMGPPQDRYIVVLNEGLDLPEDVAVDVAIQTGGRVNYVYEHALRGFAITMPRAALASVERDPRVSYVEEDKPVSIFTSHQVPTGIQRIFADDNDNIGIDGIDDDRVDVDVAVIDTGIDFEHPDLNVVGGTDCSGGGPFNTSCNEGGGDDDNGHGTHVAGTIAAIDNGAGVVGVAPGARLWAVKVLSSNGSGWTSGIVAGIEWVTARADDIEVANMSLGGSGFSQAMYDAIEESVKAGVAYAVAAGNSDDDLDETDYSPASFDNVLTVSALADYDGEPGYLIEDTSDFCRDDQDDTLADFSNHGSKVQITAPGVCILSTVIGGYDTFSGTSMASPHAAGALALLASYNNPADAEDVLALYDQVINAGNDDWTDDSDDGPENFEPLLDVSDTALFNPTLIAGGGDEGGDTNSAPTASFTYSCTDLDCDFDGSGSTDDGSITSYDWDFGDGATGSGATVSHTYADSDGYTVTLTVTDDDGATDSESQTVTVSDGSSGGDDSSPTVDSMDPNTMGAGTTVNVTIFGDGFADGASVNFENGDGPAPEASVNSVGAMEIAASITAKSGGPPRVRVWDVRVTNPDGSSGVLVDGLTINP